MRKTMIAGLAALVGLGAMLAIGIAGLGIAADTQKSVTGNLEDTFCYNVVGAHGAGHAQCALKCAQKGIPVGLVEKGTEKMYILLPPKNEEAMPDDVLKNMEKEVTVTGKSYSKGGVEFLTVESVK
ncbi:MAG: hypothetical protein WCA59_04940 [Candidatus Binataceae bacterium]|jgi:Non-histone chromosomal protein MC1